MCGFIYNVNSFPLLEPILQIAGYDEDEIRDIVNHKTRRPTEKVLTVVPSRSGPRLLASTWWLASDEHGIPDTKVTSFNARAAKVGKSPLHTAKPKSQRSLVLARGFCEWQPVYAGQLLHSELVQKGLDPLALKPKRSQQTLIKHTNCNLMLLAAVSKLRVATNGEPIVNTAIITLPPHEGFIDIHRKSFPLVLRQSEIAKWLDPSIDWSEFDALLSLQSFRDDFTAVPVDGELCSIGPEKKLNNPA